MNDLGYRLDLDLLDSRIRLWYDRTGDIAEACVDALQDIRIEHGLGPLEIDDE